MNRKCKSIQNGTKLETNHEIIYQDARKMQMIPSQSVDLVVTSPPYPMIRMWDEMFIRSNPAIKTALTSKNGMAAFELMHSILDHVWIEVHRILKSGGFACINVGDATRTIRDEFKLFSNHSRILSYMVNIGFSVMPEILWRKQTNAPNKFMGSGMLPAGAYVTLEHEHILIFRKNDKRNFITPDEKAVRQESAYFWEERNQWFSDIWFDLKGTVQKLDKSAERNRSAAYPLELPYRLINMFSAKKDIIIDPFMGTGTTMFAAMASGRNSINFEIDSNLHDTVISGISAIKDLSNEKIRSRLEKHVQFIHERNLLKGGFKYKNRHYGFPVITNQEKNILLNGLESVIQKNKHSIQVTYSDQPQSEFCQDWEKIFSIGLKPDDIHNKTEKKNPVQLKLF